MQQTPEKYSRIMQHSGRKYSRIIDYHLENGKNDPFTTEQRNGED